jgi:hypothetical protein
MPEISSRHCRLSGDVAMKDMMSKGLSEVAAPPEHDQLVLSRRDLLAVAISTAVVARLPAAYAEEDRLPGDAPRATSPYEYAYAYVYAHA